MNKISNSNLSYLQPLDVKYSIVMPDYSQDDILPLDFPANTFLGEDVMKNGSNPAEIVLGEEFENDDASWIMACTFMIFTMQTGIGLVESGMCSMKNEVWHFGIIMYQFFSVLERCGIKDHF
jgi:hypothetical protein